MNMKIINDIKWNVYSKLSVMNKFQKTAKAVLSLKKLPLFSVLDSYAGVIDIIV